MPIYVGSNKVPKVKTGSTTINNQNKTITENGTYTADTGYTGLGEVTVSVPSINTNISSLNITPTTTTQTITATGNIDGYSPINVSAVTSSIDINITENNIKNGISILGVTGSLIELNAQTKSITANGTYVPDTGYNGFTSVTVNVQPSLQNKTYQISTSDLSNNTITINKDSNYDGMNSLTLNLSAIETLLQAV